MVQVKPSSPVFQLGSLVQLVDGADGGAKSDHSQRASEIRQNASSPKVETAFIFWKRSAYCSLDCDREVKSHNCTSSITYHWVRSVVMAIHK